MPRIDYLPSGTNTNLQRVILNNNSSNELGVNTTESSQNSDPDVLDDWYSELGALTEAAYNKRTKEEMARLATECAGLYPIEECDTEAGTLF
jgi:hypothetical protein